MYHIQSCFILFIRTSSLQFLPGWCFNVYDFHIYFVGCLRNPHHPQINLIIPQSLRGGDGDKSKAKSPNKTDGPTVRGGTTTSALDEDDEVPMNCLVVGRGKPRELRFVNYFQRFVTG